MVLEQGIKMAHTITVDRFYGDNELGVAYFLNCFVT